MKKAFAILLVAALILSSLSLWQIAGNNTQPDQQNSTQETTTDTGINNEGSDFDEKMELMWQIVQKEAGNSNSHNTIRDITRGQEGIHDRDDKTITVSEMEEIDNSELTVKVIQQVTSWNELVDKANYIAIQGYKSEEDEFIVMLVNGCTKRMVTPIYHNEEFVSCGVLFMEYENFNYDRAEEKAKATIDIYNKYNELQLMYMMNMLPSKSISISVRSTNKINMEHPARKIGNTVELKYDAVYWESSYKDGSGKYGIATIDSEYVPKDGMVVVNGVSYFDENGNITGSYYKPYDELGDNEPMIDFNKRRMLHICTAERDIGWVYAEDVVQHNK